MTKTQQALEQLKKNQSYLVLVEELKRLLSNVETLIFDERTEDSKLRQLIIKRNTIKNFIELPDDLINIESLKDVSNTDSSEN
jgi:DNA replication protein DnaC